MSRRAASRERDVGTPILAAITAVVAVAAIAAAAFGIWFVLTH